jgi:hypothetical protein
MSNDNANRQQAAYQRLIANGTVTVGAYAPAVTEDSPYCEPGLGQLPLDLVTFEGGRQSGRTYAAIRHAIKQALETHDPIVVFKADQAYDTVARICEELGCVKSDLVVKQVTQALADQDTDYRDTLAEIVGRRDFIAVIDLPEISHENLRTFVRLYRDWLVGVNVVLPKEYRDSLPLILDTPTNHTQATCTFHHNHQPQYKVVYTTRTN